MGQSALIVVDTSALMAVILFEPERESFLKVLGGGDALIMSSGTLVEAASVYLAAFPDMNDPARLFADLDRLKIDIAPMSLDQARLAAEARFRFGRGRHPAKLNFGDCFSYALAKSMNLPLLFKGDDFGRTDVAVARY